jgi:hypothetical protein
MVDILKVADLIENLEKYYLDNILAGWIVFDSNNVYIQKVI